MDTAHVDIKTVEISGEALNCCINGFPEFLKDIANSILYANNVGIPEPGKWYNFNNYLKALNSIGSTYGDDTLYAIGKQFLNCALIPANIKNFTDALKKIEEGFALNHRNGNICEVTVINQNLSKKRIELFMDNPYPYQINRGILTAAAREFNPFKNLIPEVVIDEDMSFQTKGKYIITW